MILRKYKEEKILESLITKKILYKNMTNNDKDDTISYEEGQIIDLSAGGMKSVLSKKVKKDDILLIKITIAEEELEIKGIVVREEENLDGYKTCGIRFLEITENQCDKIIKELFEIQRKQRLAGIKTN